MCVERVGCTSRGGGGLQVCSCGSVLTCVGGGSAEWLVPLLKEEVSLNRIYVLSVICNRLVPLLKGELLRAGCVLNIVVRTHRAKVFNQWNKDIVCFV